MISRADARQALWHRGNLDWKLHAGQEVIENLFQKKSKKLFVGNCARRFGKSFWLVKKALERAISCPLPLPRIKLATTTAKDLEEFILPAFEILLHDCPLDLWPGWTDGYMKSKKKFRGFANGAEIQLIGLDKNPDAGRGNYCDLYGFDEASQINRLKYIYSSVVSPMTLRRPNSSVIMLFTPPETPAHDIEYFVGKSKRENAYIELNIYQNPLLSPEDIAEARAECIDETDWLREYMCQFVVDKKRAVIPEWRNFYVKEPSRPREYPHFHKHTAMDLGTKVDLTAILFSYYDSLKNRLVIEDEAEINGPDMTTDKLKDLIISKEKNIFMYRGEFYEPHLRVSDNDNPLLLQDLSILHNLHFLSTGKDELKAMINHVRLLIKSGQIIAYPRCKKLIGCLKYAIWDEKRKKLTRHDTYGHWDHLMALVYLVRNLEMDVDPVPKHREVRPETHQILDSFEGGTKRYENLKNLLNLND